METVNNLASAASRAIWGTPEEEAASKKAAETTESETSGTEPISGKLGDVKAGEPYDMGNEEVETTTKSTTPAVGTETTLPSHPAPKATTGDITDSTTSATPLTSTITSPTTADSLDTKPSSSNTTSAPTAVEPSISAAPITTTHDTTTHQSSEQPLQAPSESKEAEAIRETKKEAEEAQVETTGAGPKTLEEKAKVGTVAGAGEEIQGESKGTGTGEEWVKSSGMGADGGDFDASKPGAGREADRLLEQKGVVREPVKKEESTVSEASKTESKERKSESGDEKGVGEGKEKKSLKEKIKAKLHIHKESS